MDSIKSQSLVDQAIQQMTDLIVNGDIPPGYRLKEEDLSAKLQISRPPIREALKALEMEGFVVRKQRRGVFVSEITKKDIWEIYTLKASVYELSMGLALEKATPEWIAKLEEILGVMKWCVELDPVQLQTYQMHHAEFHQSAFDLADHARLSKIHDSLAKHAHRIGYIRLADINSLRTSLDYHCRIVEAIKKDDRDTAVSLSGEHVIDALRQLETTLRSDPKKYLNLISTTAQKPEHQQSSILDMETGAPGPPFLRKP
jgi:DNA-binding GntR family transcriptional regulator